MDISVIVPTYQPQGYIWKCLDSLREQTLAPERYEVIIVLNGCYEPFFSQISAYIDKLPSQMSIKLLHTSEGGVSNARNIGLEQSSGDYVVFVDDDDWVSDNYLENLLERATPKNIVVANVRNFNEDSGGFIDDYLTDAFANNIGRKHISLISGRSFLSCCHCKIIPRVIIGNHCFDTRLKQSEDAVFMATISYGIKDIVLASKDTVYYRRTRKGSVRHKRSKLNAFVDAAKVSRILIGVYSTGTAHYNLLFFLTRVLGLIKNVFRKT